MRQLRKSDTSHQFSIDAGVLAVLSLVQKCCAIFPTDLLIGTETLPRCSHWRRNVAPFFWLAQSCCTKSSHWRRNFVAVFIIGVDGPDGQQSHRIRHRRSLGPGLRVEGRRATRAGAEQRAARWSASPKAMAQVLQSPRTCAMYTEYYEKR